MLLPFYKLHFRDAVTGKDVNLSKAVATCTGDDDPIDDHMPHHVLDGMNHTFWSDYSYPSLVVSFPKPVAIDAFALTTSKSHAGRRSDGSQSLEKLDCILI